MAKAGRKARKKTRKGKRIKAPRPSLLNVVDDLVEIKGNALTVASACDVELDHVATTVNFSVVEPLEKCIESLTRIMRRQK